MGYLLFWNLSIIVVAYVNSYVCKDTKGLGKMTQLWGLLWVRGQMKGCSTVKVDVWSFRTRLDKK